ncbi:Phenylalanine-tRNA ligase [Acididesulfobacillus acetoxydans]|uniref:Phenylalanine--tRNA ligase beta subunit n=1 Tax=Acididesulfobacillus acetoxydans TaxID=1561005 RepID=A0A8S0WEA0_9FIRM|nr:phenylalanine--tRNA ligase subunit beta [Acididesulfobacillus acetoxydans]CAA7599962.1 Phenylalanine-tRNA ligase [Acididesulfobacillus acetoxydans]CEJ07946.1 Phenylalanine--tRNA ligase beta subunit [Acididesulfobacillus acetoxydans]
MKVSLEWLRELVEVRQDAAALAATLTNGGIEVGSVDDLNAGLTQVVIGVIQEQGKHPNAEKLWVCRVGTGEKSFSVVTGARNLREGDKVPLALPGAQLPNGLTIQASKLKGVLSEGMLCSAEELLLETTLGERRSAGGILILPQAAPVGEKLAAYLGLDRYVLDLELYPNRPDCLAMVNVAREVSSLTGEKTHLPKWADTTQLPQLPLSGDIRVMIDEPDLCRRYAGLLVDEVKIAPSPDWMRRRLSAAGVRPINNIVDITNYVMLELGQPLHAFDRETIEGAVHVRRARAGEKLVTLDKADRSLDPDMLLIADERKALGLAGVMGGLESEVTEKTRKLLVESAHFEAVSIRRTGRRLGLRSEAANRFEKGVNPYGCLAALGRVSELLLRLGAGRPLGLVDEVGRLPAPRQIVFTARRTAEVLGFDVSARDLRLVLDRLGFSFEPEGEEFRVQIPSYRPDLEIEEDLIEEAARLLGYSRIPATQPRGGQTQGRRTEEQEFRRRLRHVLAGAGMDEVTTYSFVRAEADAAWGSAKDAVALLNPLREEQGVMRTTLIPGLLEVAQRNVSRHNLDVSVFEIGNVYLAEQPDRPLRRLPRESLRVAGLAAGKSKRHWLTAPYAHDFFYLKGILEEMAREFRLTFAFRPARDEPLLHPGRSADIYLGETKVGVLGEIHPAAAKEWVPDRGVVFELEVDPLFRQAGIWLKARSVPRYPGVQRDLAVVVPRGVPAAEVRERILELGGELLQQAEIFDVYTGQPIPEDHRSLAFSLHYLSPERTLIDEEVNALNARIIEGIQQDFGAEWRKE